MADVFFCGNKFCVCCEIASDVDLLVSMRIRIQGAKPMRIHSEPDPSHKNLNFYTNLLYVGNRSHLRRHKAFFKG